MKQKNILKIIAPSRVHLTLIDLGENGYRRGGGIGFCIEGFNSNFVFRSSQSNNLLMLSEQGFSAEEISRLEAKLNLISQNYDCEGITLLECELPGRHSGFGSGTTTSLACIEGISFLYTLNLSQAELVAYSGRGGTSGVGINTYFDGGFVFDAGRKFYKEKIVSSDQVSSPSTKPLKILNTKMPHWPVVIIKFDKSKHVSETDETNLFASVLPISEEQVHSTTYHSVFGVLASLMDGDFASFCTAINEIQNTSWKLSEINIHDGLSTIMDSLLSIGANAVGMSSVGPTLYCFSDSPETFISAARNSLPDAHILLTKARNSGRNVEWLS